MLHVPFPATAHEVPAPFDVAHAAAHVGPRLRRPRLLARAARAGAALYRRDRDLKQLLPAMTSRSRRACDVADRLAMLEGECEAHRRAASPEYSVRRHVLVLSALAAETAAARRTGADLR